MNSSNLRLDNTIMKIVNYPKSITDGKIHCFKREMNHINLNFEYIYFFKIDFQKLNLILYFGTRGVFSNIYRTCVFRLVHAIVCYG